MGKSRIRRRESSGTPAQSALTTAEVLFVRLVVEVDKYLEMKKIAFGDPAGGQIKVQRGIIRGMALFYAKMWGNGYEPYWAEEVQECEKKAIRLAKEWANDGRPEGDGWWYRHRRGFWRSVVDQRSARI